MRLETFAYVDGLESAVVFYKNAFGAAESEQGTFKNEDGTYEICALEFEGGTSISLCERKGISAIEGEVNTGNILQMCMLYHSEDLPRLLKTYEALTEGANILHPMQSAAWTTHTCDIIDKYGIRWCLMIWG